LPLIDRIIILFYYYDELKIKEISIIMSINENTVKTRISRIKQKLKLNLIKYENIN
jgi:RNA polymerase sigma-70 factor (ECF subfamily)